MADSATIDRRTMIKRAAAASALTWTAPLVIDSLASPAAAATAPPIGCVTLLFNGGNCNHTSQGTPCNIADCSGVNTDPFIDCIVLSGDCQNGPLTISIDAGCSCTFTGASAKSGPNCVVPPLAPTSVTFPAQSNPGYAQFAVNLTCT
jgi:hypothetical protein